MDVLRPLIGGRLTKVLYKTLGDPVADGSGQGGSILAHGVDHAVIVSTESATMVLEWCIRNYAEFLNIVANPEDGKTAIVDSIVDVTDSAPWRALRGLAISGFGLARHTSEDGSQLPWALRMIFENGASAVIALGEIDDATPSYQPDNLLVIFDPEMAQSFQILDAPDSAWGREVHL